MVVEQVVVPAEYDVAELSTTETDPESEPSAADARDSSAVEKACGTLGEEASRAVETLAIGRSSADRRRELTIQSS